MEVVTLVTEGAERADRLSEADYREIYEELRGKTTLRQFAEFIGSAVSFAWWSKFERGEARLDRERKAELRRAVGLPALPRAVTEVTAGVDPNARVWSVGAGRADRVVLVGEGAHEPLTLRLNGNLRLMGEDEGPEAAVTGVTRRLRARSYRSLSVRRETWERLSEARLARGLTWEEFLQRLLERGDHGE